MVTSFKVRRIAIKEADLDDFKTLQHLFGKRKEVEFFPVVHVVFLNEFPHRTAVKWTEAELANFQSSY